MRLLLLAAFALANAGQPARQTPAPPKVAAPAAPPAATAAAVADVGGVFIKADDPAGLAAWYREKLGIPLIAYEGGHMHIFRHGPAPGAFTVFAIHRADPPVTERNQFVLNLRVTDFDGFVARLQAAGVPIDKTEDYPYGRFGWIRDAEGNRIEFWTPAAP
ncbi:MAG: VOC family protein [Elusimicrobia bacterium]|nr:VOC family protein [Elusimicrobiota bacterium]